MNKNYIDIIQKSKTTKNDKNTTKLLKHKTMKITENIKNKTYN